MASVSSEQIVLSSGGQAAGNSNSSGESSGGQNTHVGPNIVFFLIISMLLSGLLREINKRTKIPYTPMLLVLGIALGCLRKFLGPLGSGTSLIQALNPHMILMVFIPVLLFESAFNCNWHVFRKSLTNILLLAAPGVLWGAIMIGFCFKYILAYPDSQLTWYQAFTLGCVLSATDPVAVVALLKELGASVKFNTLVEGESLMNDGTAMVFFYLFMDLAKGKASSAAGVLFSFVRISVGGPLLGLIVGCIMSFWIKRVIRDPILSVNITFVGAYITFYLAESTPLGVSGILALVVLGLYMSAVGRRKIHPESEHAVHNVWSYIQYSCESLIFILTGIVVGVRLTESTTITALDWIRMLVFWVLMIIVRAIMVLTFYPFLVQSSYALSRKEIVVLIYGGLRGALGMCLSLLVSVDGELPERFREITVFFMCGMAMLTIVVNGLTAGKVVEYVGMINVAEVKKKIFRRSIKSVIGKYQKQFQELRLEPSFSYADWKEVKNMSKLSHLVKMTRQENSQKQHRGKERDSMLEVLDTDQKRELRFRFTRYLKTLVWESYEESEIGQDTVQTISNCCDMTTDDLEQRLYYFEKLREFFRTKSLWFYQRLQSYPIISIYATSVITQKIEFITEATSTLIDLCEETSDHFRNHFNVMSPETVDSILSQVSDTVEAATAYLHEIQTIYTDVLQAIQTKKATKILLKHANHNFSQMQEQGFIESNDFALVQTEIDKMIINVETHDFQLRLPSIQGILLDCPLLAGLNQREIAQLQSSSSDVTFRNSGVEQGKKLGTVYIVTEGTVLQKFSHFTMIRGVGMPLDPYDFIYNQDVKCRFDPTPSARLLGLSKEMLTALMKKGNQTAEKLYRSAFVYSLRLCPTLKPLRKESHKSKYLRQIVSHSDVRILNEGDQGSTKNGIFIMDGKIKRPDGKVFGRQCYLPGAFEFQAVDKAVIVILPIVQHGEGSKVHEHQGNQSRL